MLTKLRLNFFVWIVLAGLAACATPVPVQTATPQQKGIDEPYFVQPERMAAKRAIIASSAPVDVLFLGDSIMQNYEKPDYLPVWNKYFAPRHALNLGYGMDTTGAMLWRIRQGELDGLNPRVTVLLSGTNDTNFGRTPDQAVTGIFNVIREIKFRLPQTKILLVAILPSDRSSEKTAADHLINVKNASLYAGDPRVIFLSLDHVFISDGALNSSLYAERPPERALHPNPKGQALMAAAIEPVLRRLLDE